MLWEIAARAEPAEHPAQHDVPEAAERVVARDQDVDAVAHHQRGEALAEVGGELGGAVAVAGELPGDRAGDAAAVEWERGDHVQHEQRDVGERAEREHDLDQRAGGEAERGGVERVVAEHRVRGGGEDDREDERHGEACGGDAELLARRLGVAVGAHEAAEEEQVDAAHADALTACRERVAELVQDDRAEEDDRRDDRGDEALARVGDGVAATTR